MHFPWPSCDWRAPQSKAVRLSAQGGNPPIEGPKFKGLTELDQQWSPESQSGLPISHAGPRRSLELVCCRVILFHNMVNRLPECCGRVATVREAPIEVDIVPSPSPGWNAQLY